MIEHIVTIKQYSCFICLDKPSWEPRLTNAITLAATSREWSLELALAGPWSVAQRLHTEENRVHFNKMKSRLDELPMEEFLRFKGLLLNMHHSLV